MKYQYFILFYFQRRPTGSRCIFREKYGKDAFTQYESAKLKGRFLAFNKNGNPRNKIINKSGRKAAQFVERPRPRTIKKPGYYRGKSGRISERTMNRHKKLALKQAKKFKIELPSGLLEGSGQWKHIKDVTKNGTKLEEYEVRPKTKRNKNRFYKGESRGISKRTLIQHKRLALKNAKKMGIVFPTQNEKLSLNNQNKQKRQGKHTGKDEERMDMQRKNDGKKNTKIGRKTSQQNRQNQRNGWESQSSSNGTFLIDHG